jgi:hypothetical protein
MPIHVVATRDRTMRAPHHTGCHAPARMSRTASSACTQARPRHAWNSPAAREQVRAACPVTTSATPAPARLSPRSITPRARAATTPAPFTTRNARRSRQAEAGAQPVHTTPHHAPRGDPSLSPQVHVRCARHAPRPRNACAPPAETNGAVAGPRSSAAPRLAPRPHTTVAHAWAGVAHVCVIASHPPQPAPKASRGMRHSRAHRD